MSTDNQVLELIKTVEKQKTEIQALDKPNYKTHCSWTYVEGSSNVINLHVIGLIEVLSIAAFLIGRSKDYTEACKILSVDNPPVFKYSGFTLEDWQHDLGIRVQKIQIQSKKKKLEIMEGKLNSIVSPELRAKIVLEDIQKELNEC